MCKTHYFVQVNDQLHGVLNYEQQTDGSAAFVMYPIVKGRLQIFNKLKEKGWNEAAIHERLFPRCHLQGKWSPLCKDRREHSYVQAYMHMSCEELIDGIRDLMCAEMDSIDTISKHDLAVLYRHLIDKNTTLHSTAA
ncbi:MAG: hypothetical protein HRU15_08095 [Planctomycetes bacterium]|nr:hypothetical protein [Planctomycetota bacterium]